MMARVIFLIVACIALALAAAACGGDGDTGGASTGSGSGSEEQSTLTKAAFVKQADAACKKSNQRKIARARAYEKANAPLNRSVLEEMILTVIVPEVQKQARQIAAMEAPSGEEDEVAAVAAALSKAAEAVKEDPKSALNSESSPFVQSNEASRQYGFHVCAQN